LARAGGTAVPPAGGPAGVWESGYVRLLSPALAGITGALRLPPAT
jgi:hypothetical protein